MEHLKEEYKKLCRLVDEHEVISFDIYDTVLLRNVIYPTDIFDIVNGIMQNQKLALVEFKKLRIKAEEKARYISNSEDISLDEIYKIISRKLGNVTSDKIKQIELSVEERFTTVNPFIKLVYEYAIDNKKKVNFISDMYLPKQFIYNLLKTNGFHKFEQLFISSDIGVSKASCKIYSYVRDLMKINNNWLHIGDNYISDYKNAIKCNINAYHYKSVRERANIINSKKYTIEYSIIKAIQINHCETTFNMSYWEKFGICIVSSIFLGFTIWLTEELKGKDNVYFLSRDGYIPYQLYKRMRKFIEKLPTPIYLYASRRSFQFCDILNMRKSEALDLLTAYNVKLGQEITLAEILDNIGLEKEKYYKIIANSGLSSFNFNIKTEEDRRKVKNFLSVIYDDIIENLKVENSLLIQYLNQNRVYEQSQINIVDVGWRGSTQKAIQNITGLRTNGYYFGIMDNVYEEIRDTVHGYAFEFGMPYKKMINIMDNVMMYELIFSAHHGSLIGFKKISKKIKPILKDVENNPYLYSSLKLIHAGVLNITDKYLKYFEYVKNISKKDCLKDYSEFIKSKEDDDLVQFSYFTGTVGIGNAKSIQRYVTRISLDEYSKSKRLIHHQISKNLWRNALIIEGGDKKVEPNMLFNKQFVNNLWIFKKIIKAFMNPRKALKVLLRKISLILNK